MKKWLLLFLFLVCPAFAQVNTALVGEGFGRRNPSIISSNFSDCFVVGPNGINNPALQVNCSTASGKTGLQLTNAASGGTYTALLTPSGAVNGNALKLGMNGNNGNFTLDGPAGGAQFIFSMNSSTIFSIINNGTEISYVNQPDNSNNPTAIHWLWTVPLDVTMTASTEVPIWKLNGGANVRQWNAGTLALQRDFLLAGATDAFVSASTLTEGATMGIVLPGCGTNATCTEIDGIFHASTALTTTGPITTSSIINIAADTGATTNYAIQAVGSDLFTGGSGVEVGSPTGGLEGSGSLNATTLYQNGTQVLSTAGTGLSQSGATINSNAIYQLSYQPGLLSAVNATIGVYSKVTKAGTVDNIEGSAITFSCVSNPTITMYNCGASSTCSGPTTIGTVTLTTSGAVVDGTVSNPAIAANNYIGWAITAGTCASIDLAATAQIHSN